MPGWNSSDSWHNNIAYAPGPWIALHRICERHGVGEQFRIHYDPSHAILMGQDSRSRVPVPEGHGVQFPDQWLSRQRPGHRFARHRGVGLRRARPCSAATGTGIAPSTDPAEQRNAWKKQTVFAEHELPGTARHDPLAYLQNRSVDWLDHQLAARELLTIDPEKTYLVVEHEYPQGSHPGQGAARAHPRRLARLHARDRRGGRGDVRAAARGARRPGNPGAGLRARGLSILS